MPLRPTVGHQIVREYVYAFVAVSPLDGRMSSLILPWVDSSLLSQFLAHTAETFPNEYCVMVMDRAGWHVALDLEIPSSMTLLPLPPYSPELNPVEQVWKYARTNDLRNQTFDDLDDVMDALEASLHTLHSNPDLVRSMTAFDWIITLPLT